MHAHYEVRLPAFEGPVELLLALIESQRLEITAISLADVADQYLEHVRHMPERDPAELAAFLEVAARLLVIKSRALLPVDGQVEDDDVAGDLIARLEEYRRFRWAAQWLGERLKAGCELFCRNTAPPPSPVHICKPYVAAVLAETMVRILALSAPLAEPEAELGPATVGIRAKLRLILRWLVSKGSLLFDDLIQGAPSRSEVLVTFLALLELLRRRHADASQETPFGPIIIVRRRRDARTAALHPSDGGQ